jgi:transposase-like protein
MANCPFCNSSKKQTKSGRNPTGSQRYKCKECERVYTPEPKPLGYPEEVKREAVRLYLESGSVRRVSQLLSVSERSVINWVNSHRKKPNLSR